jgi:hypothetical protein
MVNDGEAIKVADEEERLELLADILLEIALEENQDDSAS